VNASLRPLCASHRGHPAEHHRASCSAPSGHSGPDVEPEVRGRRQHAVSDVRLHLGARLAPLVHPAGARAEPLVHGRTRPRSSVWSDGLSPSDARSSIRSIIATSGPAGRRRVSRSSPCPRSSLSVGSSRQPANAPRSLGSAVTRPSQQFSSTRERLMPRSSSSRRVHPRDLGMAYCPPRRSSASVTAAR
jgi:hypothetical protein